MISAPDRLEELKIQTHVTGIDFIYVYPTQKKMDIHFLLAPDSLDDKMVDRPGNANPFTDKSKIRIYNAAGDVPDKPVTDLQWKTSGTEDFIQILVDVPGDFTLYNLLIDDTRIDPFYNDILFDFKANCPSELDCKPAPKECPPESWVDFPVDYMARDFWSYRQALLDFASLRYPQWPDRLEADAGVMLAELMSAAGDEMAYYQDRVSREAYLETATQRRSLRRHARLVDYTLHDGLGAQAWLSVSVNNHTQGLIPAGIDVIGKSESGIHIRFETGRGLKEQLAGVTYAVDADLNSLTPHIWDKDRACLPAGSTVLYVEGHHLPDPAPVIGELKFDDFPDGELPGKWVILQTDPVNPAQPARVHLVRLIEISNDIDHVLNVPVTRLVWENKQSTPFEMDLTVLSVHCNIIPATAGLTNTAYFLTGINFTDLPAPQQQPLHQLNGFSDPETAVERTGPGGSVIYLFSLPGSEQQLMVQKGADPFNATPEINIEEMMFDGANWIPNGVQWEYTPSFVGIDSADPGDKSYSLEDGTWKRVVGYQRTGQEIIHRDYASNKGVTVRFGDDVFGQTPKNSTVFRVYYRLGNGKWDNVSPGTLQTMEAVPGLSLSVTNPLSANNGMDPQTPAELRQLAPDAFRSVTYRAVRPEDYAEAAERLDWVQRAGAAFRWTGSWLSVFVTPDPEGTVILQDDKRKDLMRQLNLFRQAGREVYVSDPVFANLDVEIKICVEQNAHAGEVEERVIEKMLGKKGMYPVTGYFSPDRFTFGDPLNRSTLEASVQSVPGVRAVEEIHFRRRGWFDWRLFTEFLYSPGTDHIIRVENDRLHPERGSLKIKTCVGI